MEHLSGFEEVVRELQDKKEKANDTIEWLKYQLKELEDKAKAMTERNTDMIIYSSKLPAVREIEETWIPHP